VYKVKIGGLLGNCGSLISIKVEYPIRIITWPEYFILSISSKLDN